MLCCNLQAAHHSTLEARGHPIVRRSSQGQAVNNGPEKRVLTVKRHAESEAKVNTRHFVIATTNLRWKAESELNSEYKTHRAFVISLLARLSWGDRLKILKISSPQQLRVALHISRFSGLHHPLALRERSICRDVYLEALMITT